MDITRTSGLPLLGKDKRKEDKMDTRERARSIVSCLEQYLMARDDAMREGGRIPMDTTKGFLTLAIEMALNEAAGKESIGHGQ
jgi:hypothetical protein